MDMRALGRIVSKRPVAVLIVILIITAIFGYYASQMKMSADLRTFLPEDEMVQALTKINDEFGSTDIMEVVFVSNNAVSKDTLQDMLEVKKALLENEKIVKNLNTPDSPENSVMSPADIIILGNITLSFQDDMEKNLKNVSSTLQKMNLTPMESLLNEMNAILVDYKDIYENAPPIRGDGKVVVLLLFMPKSGGGGETPPEMKSIMENVTGSLISTNDFEIKAKVLSLLNPPPLNESSGGNMSMDKNLTALMNRFSEDMKSNMSIAEKEISLRYFVVSVSNFSSRAMENSYRSLSSAINESEEMIDALNSTENAILSGNNDTAIAILSGMINGMSEEIEKMKMVLPYYEQVNHTLATFLDKYENGTATVEDAQMLDDAISLLIPYTGGEEKQLWSIFQDTLETWMQHPQIGYDLVYQGNVTKMLCQGFFQNYEGAVMLNNSLTDLKNKINNQPTIYTIAQIDMMKSVISQQVQEMREQKEKIKEAMVEMKNSAYLNWFIETLNNLDYVMLHAPQTAFFAVNIFNIEMGMMSSPPQEGNAPSPNLEIFQALQHAFESSVSVAYKEKIEDMFLTEMRLMQLGTQMEFNMSMPEFSMDMPNFNPTVDEEISMLNNMSDEDITGIIGKIESYDPSEFLDTVNSTIPVVNNTLGEINGVKSTLQNLLDNMAFVYNTTGNESVMLSMQFYSNMSELMANASQGLEYFHSYLPRMGGFTTTMNIFSSQLKSMFSKDFTGTHAKAAMMIVILNGTYLPGESTVEHGDRMEKLEEEVQRVAHSVKTKSEIMVMGSALISKATEKTADETTHILLPVAVLLVIIILAITFRSVVDTLLGLIGLGMAILWAYGFGVMAGYDFNQIVTTVAVLLVGLGIDYAIHTILRYREELRKGRKVRKAMEEMITHLGMGLVLATITTIIAFLSNLSSPIPPVANFGVMNAVGIFGAFVIFTTFIPAVKILIDCRREKKGKLKIRKEKEREGSGVILLNKAMAMGAVGAEKHRHVVLAIVLVVSLVAAYGGMNLGTTFDIKDFLPSNLEISHTIEFMMDNFNSSGLNDNYILVEGDVATASALEATKETMNNLEDDSYIDYSQSKSVYTLIREMSEKNSTFAKMVMENDTNGDGLPDKNIVGIYEWLYDHTDDGKSILHKNSQGKFDMMLIVVRSYADTDKEYHILWKELKEDIAPLKSAGLKATPTGSDLLTYHIMDLLQGSEWNSLIITLVSSFIVLTIIFFWEKRSLVLGAITTLPVLIALLWILGTMYALGMDFNVVTVTITSLTIGLGITYAIHITHRFLEDWGKEKNIVAALRKTVRHTGTSIFGAATTTMAGFGTLSLSSMPPIRQFGEISALSILYSFILSVFILPTFLYFWAEWKEKHGKK